MLDGCASCELLASHLILQVRAPATAACQVNIGGVGRGALERVAVNRGGFALLQGLPCPS